MSIANLARYLTAQGMTYQEKAILEMYPTQEEIESDRYYVAHPTDTEDLIMRIQRGALLAAYD